MNFFQELLNQLFMIRKVILKKRQFQYEAFRVISFKLKKTKISLITTFQGILI